MFPKLRVGTQSGLQTWFYWVTNWQNIMRNENVNITSRKSDYNCYGFLKLNKYICAF